MCFTNYVKVFSPKRTSPNVPKGRFYQICPQIEPFFTHFLVWWEVLMFHWFWVDAWIVSVIWDFFLNCHSFYNIKLTHEASFSGLISLHRDLFSCFEWHWDGFLFIWWMAECLMKYGLTGTCIGLHPFSLFAFLTFSNIWCLTKFHQWKFV